MKVCPDDGLDGGAGTPWRWWRQRLRCWTRCGSTGSWGTCTNRWEPARPPIHVCFPQKIARTLPASVRPGFRVNCRWLFPEAFFCAGRLELHSLCHTRLHSGARPVPLAAHAAHQPHADVSRHRFRWFDPLRLSNAASGRGRTSFLDLCFSSGGSATSSPAMLGFRRHSSNYQRAQSSMQLDTFYEDNSLHKRQHTGLRDSSVVFLRDLWRDLCHLSKFCCSSVGPAGHQGPRRNLRTSLERTRHSQGRIWEGPRWEFSFRRAWSCDLSSKPGW